MTEPFVRPDARSFLDMLAARPRPAFTAELLAAIRGMPMDAMASLDLPVGDVATRDLTMPGPGGDIALRLFEPRADPRPSPVVVFFHGGGFCVGGIDTHAGLAAEIARRLDLPVMSVDYRLAPEHPWPAAPDDAEAAARWVAANGAAPGVDATALILAGDSAGGTLAIVTALALRAAPAAVPVRMQIALYPGTDHSRAWPSRTEFGDGYGLDAAEMALFDRHYAAARDEHRHSPLLADQRGMPATVVVTASLDPLRDEGRAYAAATVAAGVPTAFHEAAGLIHGFATYRRAIPSAQADLAAALDTARAMLTDR